MLTSPARTVSSVIKSIVTWTSWLLNVMRSSLSDSVPMTLYVRWKSFQGLALTIFGTHARANIQETQYFRPHYARHRGITSIQQRGRNSFLVARWRPRQAAVCHFCDLMQVQNSYKIRSVGICTLLRALSRCYCGCCWCCCIANMVIKNSLLLLLLLIN